MLLLPCSNQRCCCSPIPVLLRLERERGERTSLTSPSNPSVPFYYSGSPPAIQKKSFALPPAAICLCPSENPWKSEKAADSIGRKEYESKLRKQFPRNRPLSKKLFPQQFNLPSSNPDLQGVACREEEGLSPSRFSVERM